MAWEVKMLTVAEVSEILRIGEKTIRDLLRDGALPGVKIGKAWRIPEDDLKNYIRGDWKPEEKND